MLTEARKYIKLCKNISKNLWKFGCNIILEPISGPIYKKNSTAMCEVVYPEYVTSFNTFPDHLIPVPTYYKCGTETQPDQIIIKTNAEIQLMKLSCALASKTLQAAKDFIRVGVSTDELDRHIHNLIIRNNAYPSPLHYNGFPKSICTAVNNVVCHGIPDLRKLKNGDIITVDITVFYKGFHGDCAATFIVGDVPKSVQNFVRTAEDILYKAISVCKPGQPIYAIGEMIDKEVNRHGLCVLPGICGHGIGRYFHEQPHIPHTCEAVDMNEEIYMEPGMTFTIEPVIGEGGEDMMLLDDQWTVITEDDSRTAQFEHTILITNTGAEILTK